MYKIDFNDTEAALTLNRVVDSLSDLTPFLQEVGEFMVFSTKTRFGQGTAPDGTPWAPKSQTTLDAYAARGDRIDTRPLFGPSGMLSSTIFYSADATGVEWGSSRIYAAVMQFGAEQGEFGARMGRTKATDKRPRSQDYMFFVPWGDIPARPYLGVSASDSEALVEMGGEYLGGLAQPR